MNPSGWWSWLPAIALGAALAAVLALYLLHPPARRLILPSTLVWERVLRGSHRRQDRLRWWFSLLLACLIAALITLQLLRHLAGAKHQDGADRLVIAIDNSPTMAARGADGLSRLTRAKTEAHALLNALPGSGEAMVTDTLRTIALPRFEAREQARARLDSIALGHDLAPQIVPPALQAGTLHVFTDGVLLRALPPQANVHSVFEPADNVGITRFELRAVPGQPGRQEAFVQVSNAGVGAQRVQLALGSAKGIHDRRAVDVPGRGKGVVLFDVSLSDSGPIRVALDGADALAADDAAYGYLPRRAKARLTLVTAGNPYLEQALAARPDVQLSVVRPAGFQEGRDADLYVFDRQAPARLPLAPALLIRTPADWLAKNSQEAIAPQIGNWESDHPVLQHLSLRDLYVGRAQVVRAANPGAQVLMRSRRNEALMAVSPGEPRRLWLAFSLQDSNFALQADFPLFLGNAIAWLTAQSSVLPRRVGRVVLPFAEARLVGMDGRILPVQSAGRGLQFDAPEPGIYTALFARGTAVVTVNLLSPEVTQINDSILEPAARTVPSLSSGFDPWPALLLAAVALLLLEWVTYHRRLTV